MCERFFAAAGVMPPSYSCGVITGASCFDSITRYRNQVHRLSSAFHVLGSENKAEIKAAQTWEE